MSGRRRCGTLPAVSAAGVIGLLKQETDWLVDITGDLVLQPSTKPRRLRNGLSVRLVWRDRHKHVSLTMCFTLDGWSPAMLLRTAGAPPRQVAADA